MTTHKEPDGVIHMTAMELCAAPAVQDAPPPRAGIVDELAEVINRHSAENISNTPDFVIAEFMCKCLAAIDDAINQREQWYGRSASPAVAYEPRTAATPGDPANVIRPEDGGLSEYTATQEDAPPSPSPEFWRANEEFMREVRRMRETKDFGALAKRAPKEDSPLPDAIHRITERAAAENWLNRQLYAAIYELGRSAALAEKDAALRDERERADHERKRADMLWQECENLRAALGSDKGATE